LEGRILKYDLIVVGGGPGGLMAAKTATEAGLKVLLIERKRNITETNRACLQIFYTNKLTRIVGGSERGEPHVNGYIEPVSVEVESEKTRFHFPVPGFSIDYTGPLRPYLNHIELSPSGYQIYRYKLNDRPWAFNYDKDVFLTDLLDSAKKAGAEIWPETLALGAENAKDGVTVQVRRKSGEETLNARTVIAADGLQSRIVDSLGLNKMRQPFGAPSWSMLHYIVEGIETGLPGSAYLSWTIPSINPEGYIAIGMWSENRNVMTAISSSSLSLETVYDNFMNDPRYAHMFRNAQIVKKEAFVLPRPMLTPIMEPVAGNVVIVGDAGVNVETWIQGAVACGYQAVKAIKKELNGQRGYPEYIAWWQHAFHCTNNISTVLNRIANYLPLPKICSDEEIDYIYSLFHGRLGIPETLIVNNLELIKEDRPELHEKLSKGVR
jgi:digeranylgeranylglycerophospholipid reductase